MNCACGVSTEVRIVLTVGTCLCRQRNVTDTHLIDVWSVATLTKVEPDHLGVSDGKGVMVKIRSTANMTEAMPNCAIHKQSTLN